MTLARSAPMRRSAIKAVTRAFRWRRMLESGRYSTVNELAEPEKIKQQIEDVIGIDASDAVMISAKTGLGVPDVLEAIVTRLPPPKGDRDATLKAFGQSGERLKLLETRGWQLFQSTMWVLGTNTMGRGITDTGIALGGASATSTASAPLRPPSIMSGAPMPAPMTSTSQCSDMMSEAYMTGHRVWHRIQ